MGAREREDVIRAMNSVLSRLSTLLKSTAVGGAWCEIHVAAERIAARDASVLMKAVRFGEKDQLDETGMEGA